MAIQREENEHMLLWVCEEAISLINQNKKAPGRISQLEYLKHNSHWLAKQWSYISPFLSSYVLWEDRMLYSAAGICRELWVWQVLFHTKIMEELSKPMQRKAIQRHIGPCRTSAWVVLYSVHHKANKGFWQIILWKTNSASMANCAQSEMSIWTRDQIDRSNEMCDVCFYGTVLLCVGSLIICTCDQACQRSVYLQTIILVDLQAEHDNLGPNFVVTASCDSLCRRCL